MALLYQIISFVSVYFLSDLPIVWDYTVGIPSIPTGSSANMQNQLYVTVSARIQFQSNQLAQLFPRDTCSFILFSHKNPPRGIVLNRLLWNDKSNVRHVLCSVFFSSTPAQRRRSRQLSSVSIESKPRRNSTPPSHSRHSDSQRRRKHPLCNLIL